MVIAVVIMEIKATSGNQGNKDHKGNSGDKKNVSSDKRKNYGKPDHVDSDISFATARHLAVNYGLTGYDALPPGIAKNLARGKPLPPCIAKKPYRPQCSANCLTIRDMNGESLATTWC